MTKTTKTKLKRLPVSGSVGKKFENHHSALKASIKLNRLKKINSSWVCKRWENTVNHCLQAWRDRWVQGVTAYDSRDSPAITPTGTNVEGRKTWTVTDNLLEAQSIWVWELKKTQKLSGRVFLRGEGNVLNLIKTILQSPAASIILNDEIFKASH